MKRIIIKLIIILTFFIITFSAYKLYYDASILESTVNISIPKGASMSKIIDIFNDRGLLKPKLLYLALAKYEMLDSKIKVYAGYYKFEKGMTNREIFNSLFSGKNLYVARVTFPEGISIREFSQIIEDQLNIKAVDFIKQSKNKKYLDDRKIPIRSLEGYLMPNTYEFFKDISADEVIDYLLNEQDRIWNQKFAKLAEEKGISRHKVLTIASIIEAETPIEEERPIVSSLYQNRLRKGMRLQADPTVQYALGEKKRLSYDDLKVENAYNTYVNTGLPPGPINNPSVSSIEAALKPAQTDFIYMVARGDGTNRHNFAKTMSEHEKNVKDYRRNR